MTAKKPPSSAKSVKSPSRKKNQPRKKSNKKKSGTVGNRLFKRSVVYKLLTIFILFFGVYLYFLDQQITQRFEGRIWQLPAHVYARPLELYIDKSIAVEQLNYELEYLNYQKVNHLPDKPAQYRRWGSTFEIKTREFEFWDGAEQSHTIRVRITDKKVAQLTNIHTDKKANLVRFDAGYLTGIFPSHSEDRILLKLDDTPDMFIKMLILIEDRRYFSHWGVDPRSIARALTVNLTSGQAMQGEYFNATTG